MRLTVTRHTMIHKPSVSKKIQQLARQNKIPVTIGRAK